MITKISIENFKCFKELELELKPLTVLCGVNSGGKSSVIQAILLACEAIEKQERKVNIDLMNSKYRTDLYSFDEILYEDTDEDSIKVELFSKSGQVSVVFTSIEEDNNILCDVTNGYEKERKVWYLGANRIISLIQKRGNSTNIILGDKNEYLAYILDRGRSNKIIVDKKRNCKDKDNNLLITQVNEWLDYILKGNSVMASSLGADNILTLEFGKEKKRHRTNIGFGVGFVLPIIVSGLLAGEGDILIVENPELHLHPKAQSDIAIFLAMVANAGVQVLVETHSDHVVNGIRKAVVDSDVGIKNEAVEILFFGEDKKVKKILLNSAAEFSDWPADFMEQFDVDLHYIRRMRMKNENNNANK